MSIIALVGNRGAGKTTLAANLAAALAQQAPTVLLDADPRGAAVHWGGLNGMGSKLPVVEAGWNLEQILGRGMGRYEHMLIDCPPTLQGMQIQQALEVSDIALVPVQPSPIQLWATVRVDQAIDQARDRNPGLDARLVINQLQPRARITRQLRRGMEELGIPAASTPIRCRAVYPSCLYRGHSVHDVGSWGRAASQEIKQLMTEVFNT